MRWQSLRDGLKGIWEVTYKLVFAIVGYPFIILMLLSTAVVGFLAPADQQVDEEGLQKILEAIREADNDSA